MSGFRILAPILLLAGLAAAQAPPPAEFVEIAPRVFAIVPHELWRPNGLLVAGSRSALAVIPMPEPEGVEAILHLAERTVSAPVRTVVLLDEDEPGAAYLEAPGFDLVAHPATRRLLAEARRERRPRSGRLRLPDRPIAAPPALPAQRIGPDAGASLFDPGRRAPIALAESFDLGGIVVEVLETRSERREGELVIWLPGDRILFTGGLLAKDGFPVIAGAELDGWALALDQLAGRDPLVVVPGRGGIGDADDLRGAAAYLRSLIDAVSASPEIPPAIEEVFGAVELEEQAAIGADFDHNVQAVREHLREHEVVDAAELGFRLEIRAGGSERRPSPLPPPIRLDPSGSCLVIAADGRGGVTERILEGTEGATAPTWTEDRRFGLAAFPDQGQIRIYALADGRELERLNVGGRPRFVHPFGAGSAAAVVPAADGAIALIDLESMAIRTMVPPLDGLDADRIWSGDPRYLLVGATGRSTLGVIDLARGAWKGRLDLPGPLLGFQESGDPEKAHLKVDGRPADLTVHLPPPGRSAGDGSDTEVLIARFDPGDAGTFDRAALELVIDRFRPDSILIELPARTKVDWKNFVEEGRMPAGSAAALRPLFSSCAAAGATLRFFGETIADGIAAGDLDGAPEGILDPRLIDLRSPSAGAGDGTSERREAATRTFDRHRRERLARMLRDGSDDVPPRRALVLIAAAAGPEELGLSRVRDARTLLSAGR